MRTLTTAIGLAILGLSAAAHADMATRKQTSIDAQALEPALRAFARERKLSLVFVQEDLRGLSTRGVIGELTAREALTRLLQGTGLTHVYVDESTISILPQRPAQADLLSKQNMRIAYRSDEQSENRPPAYAADAGPAS